MGTIAKTRGKRLMSAEKVIWGSQGCPEYSPGSAESGSTRNF